MTVTTEVANLTTAVDGLTAAVNVKKQALDTAVSNAQTAVTDATSQVSLAAAEKVGAQTARDTAETFKDQAYTYSQSAASAVAYQDLTAIAETKAESAVDVFVYDTTKDSDGGAWRQRTQHTSWYNETLNTATRGSRKEFPAVAVIVAESNKVTIYDGDDPSMPMWMVFSERSGGFINTTDSVTGVVMLNGLLARSDDRGTSVGYGLATANFIEDKMKMISNQTDSSTVASVGIEGRSTWNFYSTGTAHSQRLVNGYANDVAMTVLPDAPIDPATGLPIPTIAVATDGGVSVIKDDGTVVDIYYGSYTASRWVDFDSDYALWCNFDNVITNGRFTKVYKTLPNSDLYSTGTPYNSVNGEDASYSDALTSAWAGDIKWQKGFPSQYVNKSFGYDDGLLFLDENKIQPSNGSICDITSDYNTGWMNGDIKLATLSDTDDTDLVGSELVTNGTFDTDTAWTLGTGFSISSGALNINTSSNYQATTGLLVQAGKTYVVTFDYVYTSGTTWKIRIGGDKEVTVPNVSGSYSYTLKSELGLNELRIRTNGAVVGSMDNISVRLAEPDRSVNNNGLQVFGTVQKNPVATGADLVAYSGFSSTNYLEQPYNSDLDFGTGDFCVMGWVKVTAGSTNQFILTRYGSSAGFTVYLDSAEQLQFRTISDGSAPRLQVGSLPTGTWTHIACLRFDGVLYSYVNGSLKGSLASTVDISSVDTITNVGVNEIQSQQFDGSLALIRISATAPTAEQIEKIYNDEKVLFQEGAQATLYGTSDAVTALAYDDTTELLHVGTSGGRSVFQGLKRVDNTTDAVGTAISASNNLVVEE